MRRVQQYPDIIDILAEKARGRRERASLSFAEKLAIPDKLREKFSLIIVARHARALMREEPIDSEDQL